jgi:hypothetical protein
LHIVASIELKLTIKIFEAPQHLSLIGAFVYRHFEEVFEDNKLVPSKKYK